MKTAVEWLYENLKKGSMTSYLVKKEHEKILEQAKEMEEEQRKQDIINAWNSAAGGDAFHTGEDYYINFKSK